jgi:hypothetical protein
MNIKFRWLLVAVSGAVLVAPVQAKPSHSSASNNASAPAPAPRASTGASGSGYRSAGGAPAYRPGGISNYSAPRGYSSGQRFSSMPTSQRPTFGSAPSRNYGGSTRTYSSGQRFSSMPTSDTAWRQRFPASNVQSRSNTGTRSVSRPRSDFQSSNLQTRSNTGPGRISQNRSGFDRTGRTGTGVRETDSRDRRAQFGSGDRTSVNRAATTGQNQVFARHSANWQPNWDKNCDHWWNGHRCRFINGSWVIFNIGFYPWWPIGYPYDYYYGYGYYPYGYDYYPYGYGYGYDSGYYGDSGYNYGDGEYYGQGGYGSPDQYGDGDSSVAAAQERLARLGYYRGRIDGVFGPETQRALIAFQRDRGLNPSGYLTQETRSALGLRG